MTRRSTDAFPTTWEIPVGIGLVWLLAAFLALPAGQGVAFVMQGDGFLGGEPGKGIGSELRSEVPPAALVYAAAVVVELMFAAAAVVGFTLW